MNNIKKIKAIDYIINELRNLYDVDAKIRVTEDNCDVLHYIILEELVSHKCFESRVEKIPIYDHGGEYSHSLPVDVIYHIDTLALFNYKRKLLGKMQKSIINIITLEKIARFIGEGANGLSIIEVLKECGVPDYLIIYPNTKWRMVYSIFTLLSTSIYEEGHKLLFAIIETFLSPIRFDSIEAGIEKQKHFSEFLSYDGYEIVKGKIEILGDKRDMYDVFYESKEGKIINISGYDRIKDVISNDAYKKITLLKGQDGEINFIEGERHIDREGNRYIDLEQQFPFSNISTSVHEGKGSKYIVNEKLKLKKEDK